MREDFVFCFKVLFHLYIR